MVRGFVAAIVVMVVGAITPASAQELTAPERSLAQSVPAPPAIRAEASQHDEGAAPVFWKEPARPAALPMLYVSYGVMQVVDFHTTMKSLSAGAREGNPVLAPLGNNRVAMVAYKAAATAGTIWAAERLWKKSRVGAVATMVACNGVMAAIAAHNLQVAATQRRAR